MWFCLSCKHSAQSSNERYKFFFVSVTIRSYSMFHCYFNAWQFCNKWLFHLFLCSLHNFFTSRWLSMKPHMKSAGLQTVWVQGKERREKEGTQHEKSPQKLKYIKIYTKFQILNHTGSALVCPHYSSDIHRNPALVGWQEIKHTKHTNSRTSVGQELTLKSIFLLYCVPFLVWLCVLYATVATIQSLDEMLSKKNLKYK